MSVALDPEQRILRLVGGGNGTLYEARVDGTLQWWRHTGSLSGAATWIGPRQIGVGWNDMVDLLADHAGALYVVYGDGRVRRFRYVVTDPNTGAGFWETGSGTQVATGFNQYPRVFGGPDGVLYGVDTAGVLWRTQYNGSTLPTPGQIGNGWNNSTWLGADTGGVIYGIRNGFLTWWRYTGTWVNQGRGDAIGDNQWGEVSNRMLTPGGQGVLYLIDLDRSTPVPAADDRLRWWRLTNYLTAGSGPAWAAGGGSQVGLGWTAERTANLHGYAQPQTVTAGQTVGVAASTPHPTVTVSVWRYAPTPAPTQVVADQSVSGQYQLLPANYRSAGCGWANLSQATVQASWPSGVYAFRLVGPSGLRRDMPFIVRPTARVASVAVIMPTFTYNAYNTWGGHSAYTPGQAGVARTITLKRPSYTTQVEAQGRFDFELYSDLLLLRWLSDQGRQYDVYGDQDLNVTPGLLAGYRLVVLPTHPEYLTATMRQAIATHVTGGGSLLYTGANGLYEQVDHDSAGASVTYRGADGSRRLFRNQGLDESQVLGVHFVDVAHGTLAPYQVVHDHWSLAGTGLVVGSQFGAGGFNHAASGIELDQSPAGSGSPTVVAVGQNADGGSHLTITEPAGGGVVFAASSLTFNGALADPALSRLLRNVVDRALT
jgi:N,N-dimethylformamidase